MLIKQMGNPPELSETAKKSRRGEDDKHCHTSPPEAEQKPKKDVKPNATIFVLHCIF